MVRQISDDTQFGTDGRKVELQNIALMNDELLRQELSAKSFDDVAIDLDHVQRPNNVRERLRNGAEAGPDRDHLHRIDLLPSRGPLPAIAV